MRVESKIKLGSGDYTSFYVNGDNKLYSELEWYTKLYNLQNIMNRQSIYPRYKIYVLNQDETIRYQIPNEDIALGGSFDENYQNGSRRTLSFSLINDSNKYTPKVGEIWNGTRIKFEVGIEIPEQCVEVWFDNGIYIINKSDPQKTPSQKIINVNCADKFSLFEGSNGSSPYVTKFEQGELIKNIIVDILSQSMGNGYLYDPKNIFYDPVFEGRCLPIDLTIESGQPWSEVLLQLAEMLSAEIFYDKSGVLNIIPLLETTKDGDKQNIAQYSDQDGTIQNINFQIDMDQCINKIFVIGRNINGHICMAEATNDDPASPISVDRIGIHVGDIINDSNITSDILAQERADYELRMKSVIHTTVELGVFFNPILSVNNIISISDDDFKLNQDRFLIQSISYPIDYSGTVSLQISNINNIPFII